MSEAYFHHLLDDLRKIKGLEKIVLNADGEAAIGFDLETLVSVHFKYIDEDNSVYLYAPLAYLLDSHFEALCRWLLSANLFGYGTAGMTLAVDWPLQKIYCQHKVSCDHLTAERLIETFKALAYAVQKLRKEYWKIVEEPIEQKAILHKLS